MLQLLESAGIKLAGVVSDVFGASGMLMLRALAEGSADATRMADVAKRWLRRKVDELAFALDGQLAEYQRLLLGLHIRRFAEIDRDLAEIEAAINDAMRWFASQRAYLATIPRRGRAACDNHRRRNRHRHGGVRHSPAPCRLGDVVAGIDLVASGFCPGWQAWTLISTALH